MGRRAVQDGSDLGLCSTTRLTAGITALSVAADGPVKAMSAVRHALRIAKARRMPVHVSIALDALTSPATALPAPIDCIDRGMAVDSGAVLEAVARINRCTRPAILVGRGVRPAGPELVQLAEILHCPVLTTPTAKGEFPESHPLSAGVYSFAHGRLAHQAIRTCDLLIAIGCGLGEFASRNWDPCFQDKVLIHVDDDPAEFGRNFTPAVAVLGDAATAIRSLAAALGTRLRIRRHWPRQLVSVQSVASNPTSYKRGVVDPAAAFRVVQRLLPGDARVLADIGSVSALAVHHLRINAPQRFYLPLGYACVGHAVAAAVGVRAASGKQTVVCAGDAAFLSNTELHTAVEMRLGGLVYVIANNAGNWMVESGLRQQFGRHHRIESGMFRAPANIAAIARGMGARATIARTLPELEAAFRAGLDAREPTVIDLRTQCVPPPMLDRVQFLTKARVRP
jgi:acetolactate synthase-1/2/3 large subunit